MGLFSKGIKLKKSTATSLTLIETPLPKRVVLPLKQYIGEPAKPSVKVGDKVKTGQLIATADQDSSLPLHASISGKVADITERIDHKGNPVASIIIESDGKDAWIKPPEKEENISSLAPSEILNRIHEAGLISKGLSPIPLARDLVPIDQPKTHLYLDGRKIVKKTDTLLIAAIDTEPSLGVNRYLAGTDSGELSNGIVSLKAITGAEQTVFVVDKGHLPCPQLNEMVGSDEEEATHIISVDGMRFPLALSIPMIKAALGREVPIPYGHPRDVGVALYDIDTVVSIGASVHRKIPRIESLITVGGGGLSRKGIVKVRIGTQAGELIESLGGFSQEPAKIILGGPMTGMAQYELGVPITKEVHAVFVMTKDEIQVVGHYRECINCGLCVRVCPVNLIPGMLSMYCAKDRFEMAASEGLFCCIECGCCDYVCPSRRPLVHLFRHAKNQLMEGSQ
jgi:electron transport complex protein RnfC